MALANCAEGASAGSVKAISAASMRASSRPRAILAALARSARFGDVGSRSPGPWSLHPCRLFPDLWPFRNRLDRHRLRKQRTRSRLLVLNAHAQRRKPRRAAQPAILKKKDGHFVRIGRGLQNDRAQLAHGAHQFGSQRAHALHALHLRMKRGGGLEFQPRRSLLALGAQHHQPALAARGQKSSTAAASSA